MWDILANETHQVKKVLIASSRSMQQRYSDYWQLPRRRHPPQLGRSHRPPPSLPRLAIHIPRRWLRIIRHLGKNSGNLRRSLQSSHPRTQATQLVSFKQNSISKYNLNFDRGTIIFRDFYSEYTTNTRSHHSR